MTKNDDHKKARVEFGALNSNRKRFGYYRSLQILSDIHRKLFEYSSPYISPKTSDAFFIIKETALWLSPGSLGLVVPVLLFQPSSGG